MKRAFGQALGLMLALGAWAGNPGAAVAVTLGAGAQGGWSIGSLDPQAADWQSARFSDEKFRLPGLTIASGWASLRPWIGFSASRYDASLHGISGFLIDLPVGGFRFTPSIGAGFTGRSTPDAVPALELRSQFEVGYEFGDRSRLTLGFSRSSGNDDSHWSLPSEDAFALRYRLPFGD